LKVSLSNYGNYSSDNYGSCRKVTIGDVELYFSYDTVVAFYDHGLVIRQNDWSTTTGRHLNWINPDKSIRISGEEFEKRLEKFLKKHKLW
jgi:hypothetical protein